MNAKRNDDSWAIYGITEYSDLTSEEYQNVLLQQSNKLRYVMLLYFFISFIADYQKTYASPVSPD